MNKNRLPHVLALAAGLALSSAAFAAPGELRPLSESEMSDVYGRGLGVPALQALGALTNQEQSGAGLGVPVVDASSLLGAMASESAQGIDRQAQQNAQATANGIQATVRVASTLAAVGNAQATIASAVTLPLMALPLFGLVALPALPSLDALKNKH